MRTTRYLLAVAAAVACCLVLVWLATSIQGSQKTYEVRPYITVPEYRTDAARAIDAYERLMERYMDLTERNLFRVGADIQDVVKKLDSIDARIARIEKALGIEQTNLPAKKKPQPKPVDKKPLSSAEG